jgi:hypothetical protein
MAPAFTSQERHTLRCLGAIAGSLDFWRAQCVALERRLAYTPGGPARVRLLRDLLAAREGEERAIRDLRDGAVHLVGLVPSLGGD